jgi:hypothetical protein
MSDKKVLTINPELFSFSNNNNKTKRVKPKKDAVDKIRVRNPVKKKHDTLRRQSLLKMIRKQQEDRYNKIFENNNNPRPDTQTKSSLENIFNKEFDQAKDYLSKLSKKTESIVPKNTTLRNYSSSIPIAPSDNPIQTHILPSIQPLYGCLKNGSLPTYRNYMNRTRDNRSSINIGKPVPMVHNIPHTPQVNQNSAPSTFPAKQSNVPENILLNSSNMINAKINEGLKRVSEIKQRENIMSGSKYHFAGNRTKKQRRTLRRTYSVGRSRFAPKVSVLVSNKTIRNRISTKTQLLKQVPINDVKRFLIKQGIIRVGSTTPNDVLRKMYETLSLICGDVYNHNPDTLLYNYMNGGD